LYSLVTRSRCLLFPEDGSAVSCLSAKLHDVLVHVRRAKSVDVLPFGVHGRYRLPGVPSDVEPLATRHAHGAIVAPNAVQSAVQGCHATAAATTAHGGHRAPPPYAGVEPLHTCLVARGVKSPKRIYAVLWDSKHS
jgi:hypothetical protein